MSFFTPVPTRLARWVGLPNSFSPPTSRPACGRVRVRVRVRVSARFRFRVRVGVRVRARG